MNGARKFAITLAAALVAGVLLIILLPTDARAPQVATPDLHVGNAPAKRQLVPLAENTPVPDNTPAEDPPPTPPDEDPTPALRMRLLDDASGEPIAATEAVFALVDPGKSDGLFPPDEAEAPFLFDVPALGSFGSISATTRADGVLDYPAELDLETLRWDRRAVYPLPPGWLPVTKCDELLDAITERLGHHSREPIDVRLYRGATVTVYCTREDGTPAAGVDVRLVPDMRSRTARAYFGQRIEQWHWDALQSIEGREVPPLAQEGTDGDAFYSFKPQHDKPGRPEPPAHWRGISDADGIVTLTGVPQGLCRVTAVCPAVKAHMVELDVHADAEARFSFAAASELTAHIHWLGEITPEDWLDLYAFDGRLIVHLKGQAETTVRLTGLTPGRYDVYPTDNTLASPAFELKPGANEIDLYYGPDSEAEWAVTLSVNDRPIDTFELDLRPVESAYADWPWGYGGSNGPRVMRVKFVPDVRVRVRPGVYRVQAPSGEVLTLEFQPGEKKVNAFAVQVREVTFSITREFADWIGAKDDSGLELRESFDANKSPHDGLRFALATLRNADGESLADLTPTHTITLPLPPGIYGLYLFRRASAHTIIPNQLDLTDPARTHVEFNMDGWPGVKAIRLHWTRTTGDEQVRMWPIDDGPWPAEFSEFDEAAETLTYFAPTGTLSAHCQVGKGRPRRNCWIDQPGSYEVKEEDFLGPCSLALTPMRDLPCTGWMSWRRSGIEYYCRIHEGRAADRLPAGSVTVHLRRTRKEGSVSIEEFATTKVEVGGDDVLDPAPLTWGRGGQIRIQYDGPRVEDCIYHSGDSWDGDDFYERRFEGYTELASVKLPDGDYHVIINITGRPLETRTVQIRNGKNAIIDLRK